MAVTDRVGIAVNVLGYDAAHKQMETLEGQMKGLGGRKVYVEVQARVKELDKKLKALRSERVVIQTNINDIDKKTNKLRQRLERLKRAKIRIKLSDEGTKKVDARIKDLQARISALKTQRIHLQSNLGQANTEIRQITVALGRLKTALSNVKSMSLGQIFNKTSSMISHAGQTMQSAGNALTKATSPFNALMRGTLYGAGYALFNTATQGLANATQRADIMSTYVPIMRALGHDSKQAETAIEHLNDAVLGLPTGLDEIVEQHKLLTMAIGDVEKAEKLAIGANNAYIASGADESKVTMAKKELQTLAQTGKLNERQWMTVQKGIATAWNEIEKGMQKTNKIEGSLLENLKSGKVTAEEFMDALSAEGISGVTADVVNEMKHTFSAATSNVQIAFSRLGKNVIDSLGEVLKENTGGDVIDTIISLSGAIDKLSGGISNWIKANPDVIMDFFNAIKGFDWKGLAQGVGEGMKTLMQLGTFFANFFSGGGFFSAKNIGRFMVFGSIFGKCLTVAGGLLKGARHILSGMATIGLGLSRLLTGFGGVLGAKILTGAGAKIKKLTDFFKDFGKIKKASETAESATKADSALKKTKNKTKSIKSSIRGIVSSLSGLATVAGGVLITGGTIWASVKMIKSVIKDLGEISKDMEAVDPKAVAVVGGAIASAAGAVAGIMKAMKGGGFASKGVSGMLKGMGYVELAIFGFGTMLTTITGFAWINSALIKKTIGNVKKSVESVADIVDGINALKGVNVDTSGLAIVTDAISNAFDILDHTVSSEGTWYDNAKTKKLKKKFDNVASVIDTVAKATDDLSKISKVEGLAKAKENIGKIIGTKTNPGIMEELYSTLQGSFDVSTKKDVKGSDKAKTITDNISEIIDTVAKSVDDIKSLATAKIDFKGAKTKIEEIGSKMADLYNGLYAAFVTPETSKDVVIPSGKTAKKQTLKTGGEITKSTIDGITNVGEITTGLSGIITDLKSIYDSIAGDEGLGKIDMKKFSKQFDVAREMVDEIATQWDLLGSAFTKLRSAKGQSEKLGFIAQGMESIKKVMGTLASIGQGIQNGAYGDAMGEGNIGLPSPGEGLGGMANPTGFIDYRISCSGGRNHPGLC